MSLQARWKPLALAALVAALPATARADAPGKRVEIALASSEGAPNAGKVADKFSILRSCRIGNETWEHGGGAYWLTGNPRRTSTPNEFR